MMNIRRVTFAGNSKKPYKKTNWQWWNIRILIIREPSFLLANYPFPYRTIRYTGLNGSAKGNISGRANPCRRPLDIETPASAEMAVNPIGLRDGMGLLSLSEPMNL
jgi:hypothetical protein